MGDILPLINHGHEHYGENKVQEALEKWKDIKDLANLFILKYQLLKFIVKT